MRFTLTGSPSQAFGLNGHAKKIDPAEGGNLS